MEDWQKELLAVIETVTRGTENFLQEFAETLELAAEQFQDTFISDLEAFWQEFFEDGDSEITSPENPEFVDDFLNPKVEPDLEHYPACLGCSHYHGRVYGQQIFVCAMHPYGWTDDSCPDWQKDSKTK